MKKIPVFLILVLFNCMWSGCAFVTSKMAGIRPVRSMNDNAHQRFLRKLGADPAYAYSVDTNYLELIQFYDTTKLRLQKKNHYQPIQALYFGHTQYPQVWYINCYASGFPKLNWEGDGNFSAFPPKSPVPLDSLLSLDQLIQHVKPLKHNSRAQTGPSQPYTVVFFWCRFIFRESRRLHHLMLENLKKSGEPYRIIYVNSDNLFAL